MLSVPVDGVSDLEEPLKKTEPRNEPSPSRAPPREPSNTRVSVHDQFRAVYERSTDLSPGPCTKKQSQAKDTKPRISQAPATGLVNAQQPIGAAAAPTPSASRVAAIDAVRVVTVEDSPLINKLYRRVLPARLGVEPANVRVLGSEYEVRHAVDEILSFRPDAVILDQNIDFLSSAGVFYYGTKIASELRSRGFDGLVCLNTADSNEVSALANVSDGCGVDLIITKSDVNTMADLVLDALRTRRMMKKLSPPQTSRR